MPQVFSAFGRSAPTFVHFRKKGFLSLADELPSILVVLPGYVHEMIIELVSGVSA